MSRHRPTSVRDADRGARLARSGRWRGHPDVSSFAVGENALAGIVLGYGGIELVRYDHRIIRTRSFHIEERNRTIQ